VVPWISRAIGRCLLAVILLSGSACASDTVGRTVPVRGTVTVAGQELKTGSIVFWPDADKGNTARFEAGAKITPEGTYELLTLGKPGAP